MRCESLYAPQCPNFDFKLRRDHRKYTHECCAHESVDDAMGAYMLGYVSKSEKKRIHEFKG